MNDQPSSGNRWEADEPTHTQPVSSGAPAVPTVPPEASAPAAPTEDPAPRDRSRRPAWLTTARVGAAGIGAAIFLVGGAAGYGVAHAVNGDNSGSVPTRIPGDGSADHDGFDHRGFGGSDGDDGPGGQDGQFAPPNDGSGT